MSHVKAGGTAKNVHNNAGQRLGVKRFGGQKVKNGEVLVRQTGATKLRVLGLICLKTLRFMREEMGSLLLLRRRRRISPENLYRDLE